MRANKMKLVPLTLIVLAATGVAMGTVCPHCVLACACSEAPAEAADSCCTDAEKPQNPDDSGEKPADGDCGCCGSLAASPAGKALPPAVETPQDCASYTIDDLFVNGSPLFDAPPALAVDAERHPPGTPGRYPTIVLLI